MNTITCNKENNTNYSSTNGSPKSESPVTNNNGCDPNDSTKNNTYYSSTNGSPKSESSVTNNNGCDPNDSTKNNTNYSSTNGSPKSESPVTNNNGCDPNDSTNFVTNIITSDMLNEERQLEENAILEEEKIKTQLIQEEKAIAEEKCFKRLQHLLSRSSVYAQYMSQKLEKREKKIKEKENRQKTKVESDHKESGKVKRKLDNIAPPSKKRKTGQTTVEVVNVFKENNMANIEYQEIPNLDQSDANSKGAAMSITPPVLFYGGSMRNYQLEGYHWLKVLYENGVNGILADEMGLGKTIQSIAFISNLIEMKVPGPFLVVAPLSTLPNWYSEFKRFTPNIPIILYHGQRDDRFNLLHSVTKKVKVNESLSCCPVVLTTYQVALIDTKKLSKYSWKALVVDEAHRIKNFECRLIKSLKTLQSDHRLLLTGTPLQNNLSELWSMLNFILPEIFDDLQVFQSWFDISKLSQNGGKDEIIVQEQEKQIVSTIHQILTPFLLRRTKTDVELDLPPKKELIVYAPLTALQQKYYTAVLNTSVDDILKPSKFFDPTKEVLGKRKSYKTDYFGVDNEELDIPTSLSEIDSGVSKAWDPLTDQGECVLHLRLQNPMMCLRKICNHPFLINRPKIPVDENFVKASGKLLVLDAMLPELKKRGHKVIIFSQFVSMLELLEDYCEFRKYKYCCLYGNMLLAERQEHLEEFKENSTFIFLISTKAGGLGINIVSADTVILYDSDWNPQGDLQAQDRCHRIGQTRPVVVYRYIVPKTIDQRILDYATAKRKLEKVIIQKGRFKSIDLNNSQGKITPEELIQLLESSDHSGFVKTDDNEILSQKELEKLLDRTDMYNEM